MQQLGASFINSFLLPYVQTQILGNIENDTRLQNMFRYDKVITPEELQGLEDYYFQDTGTVLATDAPLRKAFWKEFNGFVTRQKLLCENNVLKFAFRVLPDEKSGTFSQEAQDNWGKFAFYAVNRLEDTLIQREIDQKEILGTISSAQAADDKKDLKDGKMILVKGKDGKYDYMSDKTIARAIGNVERTAKMLAALKTEKTEKGETKMYTFNPIEPSDGGAEVTSSPQEVQAALLKKETSGAEKQLEGNGLFVERSMTIDAKGEFRSFAQDKNGTRILVVYNNTKPGKRRYRLYRIDQSEQNVNCDLKGKPFINLGEGELQNRFGEKKQSALEVFRDKDREAGRVDGVVKSRGTRLQNGAGRPIKLPSDRKVRSTVTSSAPRQPQEGALGGSSYVPPVTRKGGKTTTKGDVSKERQLSMKGALDAKKQLQTRSEGGVTPQGSGVAIKGNKDVQGNAGKRKTSSKGKNKSFMGKVAKIYAIGFGGAFGFGAIASLFT